jgi:DMSO/TMAO reductase YedYZ molybdopterin-dependent catalytic subunit
MEDKQKDRLPPGQVLTGKWPVLSYGETPRLELKDWRFRLFGQVDREQTLTWDDHGYYEVALDAGSVTLSP